MVLRQGELGEQESDVAIDERGPELLRLIVPGEPAGAGSKTPMPKGRMVNGRFVPVVDRVGRPIFYVKPSSEKTEPWMKLVRQYAQAQKVKLGMATLDGPLWLDCYFWEKRPGSHFYKRKSGDVLRPDAPAYPDVTETHDIDKMRRAISDSLTAAKVIADDKRVVDGVERKRYVNPGKIAGAVICLGRMLDATTLDAGLVESPEGQEVLT